MPRTCDLVASIREWPADCDFWELLPILLAGPHGGLWIPPEASRYWRLGLSQIAGNSDTGSAEIFGLRDHVAAFVSAEVARVIVDVNRAANDRRERGVLKTTTYVRSALKTLKKAAEYLARPLSVDREVMP